MPSSNSYSRWKRFSDVVISVVLMIVLLLPGILFLLLVAWETRSYPLYVQDRAMSLEGKRFRIYKLRTMRKRRASLPSDAAVKIFSKPEYAEYVTAFCGWLRRTGLDELPQMWNVLIGDMSLIGPRPLDLGDLESMKREHPELYAQRASITSKVGLSGMWQLFGNRDAGAADLVRFDMLYERNRSMKLDAELFFRTIHQALFAYHSDSIVGVTKQLPVTIVPDEKKILLSSQ